MEVKGGSPKRSDDPAQLPPLGDGGLKEPNATASVVAAAISAEKI